jgi:4-hydroxy-2-oxoheptanedioate aldolase
MSTIPAGWPTSPHVCHPVDERLNQMIKSRSFMRGLFNGTGSPALIEMTAYAGFDFSIIDNEHGSASIETTEHMLRAARAAGMPALVRCLEHDIARTLDAGAMGVQIPMIQSVEHARAVAAKVRYPRLKGFAGVSGARGAATSVRAHGYGAFGGQAANAHSNEHVTLVLMLESVEAIDQAAEIAAVPGVDCVFIGPNDLAHSMGYENQFYDPAVQAQIERAVRAIAGTGKCAGVLALSPEDEQRYAAWGASYFAATVTGVITKALKDAAVAGRSGEKAKIGY